MQGSIIVIAALRREIKEFIISKGKVPVYTIQYTPELNPILRAAAMSICVNRVLTVRRVKSCGFSPQSFTFEPPGGKTATWGIGIFTKKYHMPPHFS